MTFTYSDNIFSDLVKEVYGTRSVGRTGHLSHYWDETPENKQKIWDDLCDEHEDVLAEEKASQVRKAKAFEDRIQDVISIGARDRKTALRWILQSENLDLRDYSYACFALNVPYSYEKEFKSILKIAK
tara:strand:- start:22526 stop:22909 length:384 start_codon:yes stop_codon:yes gene_type:complete